MVSISLTKIDEWSNLFFTLLGVFALSLSHGEVGGRLFLFGGNPIPDHGVSWWKGGDPAEEQLNRPHPLPAEDINSLEHVAHTAHASAISMDFCNMFKTVYSSSREFVCWGQLSLDELDFNFRAAPLGILESLSRDWTW